MLKCTRLPNLRKATEDYTMRGDPIFGLVFNQGLDWMKANQQMCVIEQQSESFATKTLLDEGSEVTETSGLQTSSNQHLGLSRLINAITTTVVLKKKYYSC